MELQLTAAERRALRARAHPLKPVVMIADDGLSPAVLQETDRALASHELIKVRVFADGHAERAALLAQICDELGAAPVQHIGKILVVYRPRPADESAPKKTFRRRKAPRRTKRSYQN